LSTVTASKNHLCKNIINDIIHLINITNLIGRNRHLARLKLVKPSTLRSYLTAKLTNNLRKYGALGKIRTPDP